MWFFWLRFWFRFWFRLFFRFWFRLRLWLLRRSCGWSGENIFGEIEIWRKHWGSNIGQQVLLKTHFFRSGFGGTTAVTFFFALKPFFLGVSSNFFSPHNWRSLFLFLLLFFFLGEGSHVRISFDICGVSLSWVYPHQPVTFGTSGGGL